MKKSILLLAALLACLPCACQNEPGRATLRVTLDHLKETGTKLGYDGQLSIIAATDQISLDNAVEGEQLITVELDRPGYYMIFRNPLYLSPGDDLTIDLYDDNQQTVIGGTRGVEANDYLKQRYYSKGGSFLDAGTILRNETRPIAEVLVELADARRAQLRALENVSDEFREMEDIRIKADLVNSFFYYPTYNRKMIPADATREDYDRIIREFHESIRDITFPIIEELASDDRYLDIEVVRLVLFRAKDNEVYAGIEYSPRFLDLLEVSDQARMISGNMTKEQYDELLAYGNTIPYEDMKQVFLDKLAVNAKLIEGMPAIDAALRDADGNTLKLNELADKPIYVDIWATWCGPCLGEAPFFEALSKEYPDVRFVSVSVDGNADAWMNHISRKEHGAITEVLSTDDIRQKWDIVGIPRFLLIDKDFKIISSNAPRPSQRDRIKPILDSLSGK